MTVTLSVPAEVASGLVEQGLAADVPRTRSAGVAAIDVVVTAAEAGGAVVALAEGSAALHGLARRLIAWGRGRSDTDEPKTTVTIATADGKKTFSLHDVDENDLVRAILALET